MIRFLRNKRKILLTLAGLLSCAFVVYPFLWALFTSLKINTEIMAYPPTLYPKHISLTSYSEILLKGGMPRYFLNSLIVACGSVLVTLVIAAHAGYSSARFSFPGKSAIMMGILISGMIPGVALLVPLYMMATKLHLMNTFFALIMVYGGWRLFNAVWMMESFFDQVPKEIEEAAMIDGCSRIQAFYRTILPLTQPGLAATTIMTFIYVWNDFIRAYALITNSDMWVVQIGLFQFMTTYGIEWGQLMAAVMIGSIPAIILFIALQNRFIEGLTAGATKG